MKEIRNIQVTGGNTYIVSLPKQWIKNNNIKPHDKVLIIEEKDSSLSLHLLKEFKKKEEKFSIVNCYEYEDIEAIIRECIGYYLAGFNSIKVNFEKKDIKLKDDLKNILRDKLIGIEIIEESLDSIIIQVFGSLTEMPLTRSFSRLYNITLLMLENLTIGVKKERIILEKIERLDDEVDRVYHLITRQINLAINNTYLLPDLGLTSKIELIEYRLISKTLERIADHAEIIAKILKKINEKILTKFLKDFIEINAKLIETLKKATNSFLKSDKNLANIIINKIYEILNKIKLIEKNFINLEYNSETIINLRLILESFRRIAEYSLDICELAINREIYGKF